MQCLYMCVHICLCTWIYGKFSLSNMKKNNNGLCWSESEIWNFTIFQKVDNRSFYILSLFLSFSEEDTSNVQIMCAWCQKVGVKRYSLSMGSELKSFCSEKCFAACRRAYFKRNKVNVQSPPLPVPSANQAPSVWRHFFCSVLTFIVTNFSGSKL